MVTVFFNIWRKASMLFAGIMLLWVYTTLPDNIAYAHNDLGEPIGFVDKQTFFYISAAIIVFFNLIMGLGKSSIADLDFSKINPQSLWARAKAQLSSLIGGWFNALMAIVNTTLVFAFLGLNSINRTNEKLLDKNYDWLLLFLGVVLMALVFFIPIKLLFSNPKEN